MDSLQGLLSGFEVALSLENLFWVFIGCLIGTLVGILPGLGPPAVLSITLPLTLGLSPASGIIMMAGLYYGSKYGGSTTAILLNVPGENASVVTCLDGYPLAKAGRAGPALGIAAIGSFIAGTVGVIGVTLLAPPLAQVALAFGPPEYFALMVLALTTVAFLGGNSIIKGLLSAGIGLLLATVGVDIVSGQQRLVFGQIWLVDGIDFILVAVGVFAVGEVLINVEQKAGIQLFAAPNKLRELLPTWQDIKDSRFAFAQGSVIGFFVGALPGAGATVASFLSYLVEKRFSKHPEKFGTGVIEGVAAPEAANNSETGGQMIPLLSLGIPGSGSGAIMLGALILFGLQPGPFLFTDHPDVVWPIIASMYVGNVMLLILNLPLVPLWASILRLPYYVLYTSILVVAVVGVYSTSQSVFDVFLLAAFGLLGYIMRKCDVPPAPLVLAFVLGQLAELNFRQSMVLFGSGRDVFLERPIAIVVLAVAALILVSPLLVRKADQFRKRVIEEED